MYKVSDKIENVLKNTGVVAIYTVSDMISQVSQIRYLFNSQRSTQFNNIFEICKSRYRCGKRGRCKSDSKPYQFHL